jgi:site-specific recombinase XerC
MTRRTVHHVVAKAAKVAGIELPVDPHMLRHATGTIIRRTPATIRGQFSFTSAIRIFSTRYGVRELTSGPFKDFRTD